MARIYKKGKTSLVSSILNILGLTAAFAALYIILVQVHHDLTYNKALKDSDRISLALLPILKLADVVKSRAILSRFG